mgnify:CR=1 FL=1
MALEPFARLGSFKDVGSFIEYVGRLGLECFPKTSGSKGMQVYVPLNAPGVTYEQTKGFAHAVADLLESSEPDLVIARMNKDARKGKIFIDHSQNDEHKTTVCVYSLRAKQRPTVSTPVTWDELATVTPEVEKS